MESQPHLQKCVAHCADCGIRFLTDPRCAGRLNLRCPFGCRQHHRRQRSNQRSAAYYRTEKGKEKKRRLNARRYRSFPAANSQMQRSADAQGQPEPIAPTNPAEPPPADQQLPGEFTPKIELQLEGVVLDESSVSSSSMLPYVRVMVRLIDGIRLRRDEIVDWLRQVLRQHSMANRSRRDYVLGFLHQRAP